MSEQWLPLTQAAKEVGISTAKLSGMVKRGEVSHRKDKRDERKTFVNLIELKALLGIT